MTRPIQIEQKGNLVLPTTKARLTLTSRCPEVETRGSTNLHRRWYVSEITCTGVQCKVATDPSIGISFRDDAKYSTTKKLQQRSAARKGRGCAATAVLPAFQQRRRVHLQVTINNCCLHDSTSMQLSHPSRPSPIH